MRKSLQITCHDTCKALLLIAFCAYYSAHASDKTTGFFHGNSWGVANQGISGKFLRDRFTLIENPNAAAMDENSYSWGGFAGYQFNQNFSLQTFYLGLPDRATHGDVKNNEIQFGDYANNYVAGIYGTGRLDTTETISLIGKFGSSYLQSDEDVGSRYRNSLTKLYGDGRDGLALLFGIGVGLELSEEITAKLEYEHALSLVKNPFDFDNGFGVAKGSFNYRF